ncbi:uncharacterized protein K489DRAFT_142944 [Dissoconium aciculare CBS 342.82]|uniref:Uncharacterized protein n=1 Tax=Dissoconium aciculare CBS 342.82 TaxID=1314786 RepID=A0A6J3MB27_9PEZI|nr:uncharacterized protein K489DRAFT_142944 [Dissoconium aciculare CBS 342.82]KAF1824839.1 hypothetical protein K489DRAFT_142944 [Dissoconium aciculare CBS 342.82]
MHNLDGLMPPSLSVFLFAIWNIPLCSSSCLPLLLLLLLSPQRDQYNIFSHASRLPSHSCVPLATPPHCCGNRFRYQCPHRRSGDVSHGPWSWERTRVVKELILQLAASSAIVSLNAMRRPCLRSAA